MHSRSSLPSALRPSSAPAVRAGRASALCTRAMVNVDFSPSVLMGVGLIGAGLSLWQVRQSKPYLSKDYDVVVSCVSLLVGGILIFQVCGASRRTGATGQVAGGVAALGHM